GARGAAAAAGPDRPAERRARPRPVGAGGGAAVAGGPLPGLAGERRVSGPAAAGAGCPPPPAPCPPRRARPVGARAAAGGPPAPAAARPAAPPTAGAPTPARADTGLRTVLFLVAALLTGLLLVPLLSGPGGETPGALGLVPSAALALAWAAVLVLAWWLGGR